ncbi:unnamed protein product [Cuscuta campestris]|uniref:Uncharacterized protein n=1 Tax=Cuscuta campestris TaxID=132261 RepID=A0A484KI36_9ASTE|nr:unnamed protein product [Cuscuta campestris]
MGRGGKFLYRQGEEEAAIHAESVTIYDRGFSGDLGKGTKKERKNRETLHGVLTSPATWSSDSTAGSSSSSNFRVIKIIMNLESSPEGDEAEVMCVDAFEDFE